MFRTILENHPDPQRLQTVVGPGLDAGPLGPAEPNMRELCDWVMTAPAFLERGIHHVNAYVCPSGLVGWVEYAMNQGYGAILQVANDRRRRSGLYLTRAGVLLPWAVRWTRRGARLTRESVHANARTIEYLQNINVGDYNVTISPDQATSLALEAARVGLFTWTRLGLLDRSFEAWNRGNLYGEDRLTVASVFRMVQQQIFAAGNRDSRLDRCWTAHTTIISKLDGVVPVGDGCLRWYRPNLVTEHG
jgi:hypothetical protein